MITTLKLTIDRTTNLMYHYTAAHFFEHMKTGLIDGESYEGHDYCFLGNVKSGQRGLRPARPVILHQSVPVPEGCKKNAVWGFLEPEPVQWKYSREFPEVWPRILKRVGWDKWEKPVLLEVKLTPGDSVYVFDWAFMEEGSW